MADYLSQTYRPARSAATSAATSDFKAGRFEKLKELNASLEILQLKKELAEVKAKLDAANKLISFFEDQAPGRDEEESAEVYLEHGA